MSSIVILNQDAQVKLDGSGDGTAKLTPGMFEEWHPTVTSVKVATQVKEAQCRIFYGTDTSDPNYVDGTLSGSTGDSTDRIPGIVRLPNSILARWTGGDAGATATISVLGDKKILQ
jgi:hypothetical protein